MNHNNNNSNQQEQPILITCRLLNANNYGSILANTKIVIAYCNLETNFSENTKTFIGCFINPADLALSIAASGSTTKQSITSLISNNIYYFKQTVKISKMFNVEDLLKNVILQRSHHNDVTKKILHEKYPKIISICESKIKQLLYNY